MTTFKEIRGTTIEVVSTDPTNPEVGQIWYNSSSGTLKGYKSINAWAAGGNLNTARTYAGSFGTQTAALIFGSQSGPINAITTTESYNGSSWTAVNSLLNAVAQSKGVGIQTAGLSIAGYTGSAGPNTNRTESWNGSSWTAVGNFPVAVASGYAFGTQSAAIYAGGYQGPAYISTTASWNGSAWTNVPATISSNRGYGGSAGIQTAGLIFAGIDATSRVATSQSWNGSAWASSPSVNTARTGVGYAGTSQTAALMFGGSQAPAPSAATESWNGTAWTNTTNLPTALESLSGAGTSESALSAGGQPPISSATNEWNSVGTQTITVS